MTFDTAAHPRGHASNPGAFSSKGQSAPEDGAFFYGTFDDALGDADHEADDVRMCLRCEIESDAFDEDGLCELCFSADRDEGVYIHDDDDDEDRTLSLPSVPRTRDTATWDYYAATDVKHFGDRSEPGSKFLAPDLTRLEDVVLLTAVQRGDLAGDDRDLFIARGAHPDAFRDGNRYLLVRTPGSVGVINSAALEDAALLEVVRTKPGAPCSLVVSVDEQQTADYGVVVFATDEQTGEDLVITTFPGVVTKSLENETIDSLEGGALTVAAARQLLGEDFWVNTRIKPRREG